MAVQTRSASETVLVDTFTDGLLDPSRPMLGPVADGGHIIANTAPGCWGPMITPAIRGGHEVTVPVAVAGARVGDSVAIRIKDIVVTSIATASGNSASVNGRFVGDPFVAAKCPGCGAMHPDTHLVGIGPTAVRCVQCGADATPFVFDHGYTIAFDTGRSVGLTLPDKAATQIAGDARHYAALPTNSIQNPILAFAPHDLVGVVSRVRPFMGQLGTTPGVALPDSHNAGDFGSFLIGAPHQFAVTADQLEQRTDGHMDIDAVRAGSILICPVKVDGAGVYLGDMHALQGDGEIAGHTCDIAGTITIQVHVLKGLTLEGPILLPHPDDLPFLARPLSERETQVALGLAQQWGVEELEDSLPISIVGTGPDLNSATDNGLRRGAELLGMPVNEVKNRATITGAIEIGRHPGVVQVTLRVPRAALDRLGILAMVEEQYDAV